MSGRLVLNGSFASSKADPGDIDVLFLYDAATEALLRRDVSVREVVDHSQVKESGLGDLFIFSQATAEKFPNWCPPDMFDFDGRSGVSKGVLEVTL